MTETKCKKVSAARVCTEHDLIGIIYSDFELPLVVEFESGTEVASAPKEIPLEQLVVGKHWLAVPLLNYGVDNPDFTEHDAIAFGRHLATAKTISSSQAGRMVMLPPRKASLVVAGILGGDGVPDTKAKTLTTIDKLLAQAVRMILMSYMDVMPKFSRYEKEGCMIYQLDIPDLIGTRDWRKVGNVVCSRITSVDLLPG